MGRRKKTLFSDSLDMNQMTYQFYLDRLVELSISMFEWKGLPDSVDSRFLEKTLFMNGSAVFFQDDDLDTRMVEGDSNGTLLALPVILNGKWDVYNVPIDRRCYATNGYQRDLNNKNSIIVWNNMLRTNSIMACRMYAKRLWNLDRAIDVNANAQKTPVLIQATDTQRLSLKNLYMQWDGNEPFIFGADNLDINSLKVLRTDAPYVARDLYELKTQIWNEALTYLGISNINFHKKERMITDEVIRNQGGTVASRYSRLQSRQEAAEKVNKMFGTNISVEYRTDVNVVEDDKVVGDEDDDSEVKNE